MEETNYVRSGSHCKHPAYTKEEIIERKLDRAHVKVLEATITVPGRSTSTKTYSFSGNVYIDGVPQGVDKTNAVVISAMAKVQGNNDETTDEYNSLQKYDNTNNFYGMNPKVRLYHKKNPTWATIENLIEITCYNEESFDLTFLCRVALLVYDTDKVETLEETTKTIE